MAKIFPILPKHPERICWGCDRYCSADDMACGNGSDRTQHPSELFGEDWAKIENSTIEKDPLQTPPKSPKKSDLEPGVADSNTD